MIEIKRAFRPARGFERIDELPGYLFTPEMDAHTFIITKMEKVDGQETAVPFAAGTEISARLIKADGVTELVDGSLADGAAVVTLPAECYQVPGRFTLTVYASLGGTVTCIYAATSTVLAGDTEDLNIAGGTVRNIDAKIGEIRDAISDAQDAVDDIGEAVAGVPDVIASIPQDYTALSNSVGDLKSAVETANNAMKTSNPTEISWIKEKDVGVKYSDGSDVASAVFSATNYIDVRAYNQITYKQHIATGSVNTGIAFYDESKTFISGSGVSGIANGVSRGVQDKTVSVPYGACYVRCTIWRDQTDGAFSISGSNKQTDVINALGDAFKLTLAESDENFSLVVGGINPANGAETSSASACRTESLPSNGDCIMTVDHADYVFQIWYYTIADAGNQNTAGNPTNGLRVPGKTLVSFHPSSNANYYRFEIRRADGATLTTDTSDPTSDYSIILAALKVYSLWSDIKINKPSANPDGTDGQILQTNGDGTTTWINNDAPEAVEKLEKLNPDRVRTLLEYDIGRITLPNWGYYNLDASGDLQDYSTQKTRMATIDYYKSPYAIAIKNGNQSGTFILCTYNDNKTLATRTTNLKVAEISANTLFRICYNNGSAAISDVETYSNNIFYASKVSERMNAIPQLLQCFHKYTGIGDSLMAGFTKIDNTTVSSADARAAKNNWFDYLMNKIGRDGTNLAVGSSSTHSWRYADDSLGADINDADIDTDCYFVGLGVNDINQSETLGTQADINTSDITQCADSTYGNLYYILAKLHEFNPYAKIFVFTIPVLGSNNLTNINAAIEYCCSIADNAYCVHLDKDRFTVPFLTANNTNGHYNPIAYAYMSGIIEDAVSNYIYENYTDFVWIPYEH